MPPGDGMGAGQGFRGTVLALLMAVPHAHAAKGDIHIYRDENGRPFYTDQKVNPRIVDANYSYVGKYGRPTAVKSCMGMTEGGLAARLGRVEHLVDRYAADYAVDPALVKAVMRVESCFDVNAVSRVGAQGLMQLMPYTAEKWGVKDSFDPEQNIRGGVRYLSHLIKRFDNNIEHALAAYNAGPLNVEKYKGIPPFKETQSYVPRVLKHYESYRS